MAENRFEQFDVVDPKAPEEVPSNRFAQFDAPEDQSGGIVDSIARNVGEPFNRGVIGMLEFPVTLVNAAVAGGYALAGAEEAPQMRYPLSEMAQGALTAPPEEQKHGVVARFAEFTGAGVLPQAALMNYGARLAATELSAVPTALQQMGMATAKSPGVATAYDLAANFTAAAGGEVARTFTDNQTVIAMAELGSAFIPTAAVVGAKMGPTGRLTGKAYDWLLKTVAPFSEAGAKVAASARLQDVAADPKGLAAALDVDSPVPPMQQSDDPGMLQLQKMILVQDPAAHAEFTEQLSLAIKQLTAEGTTKTGNFERATHILNLRQQMAVEEAAEAVRLIGVDATPRQISVAARNAVAKSLDDATLLEKSLWDKVDATAPADIENAVEAFSAILAKRSPDADPSEVPNWLRQKLGPQGLADDDLMTALAANGMIDENGAIKPAIAKQLKESGAIKPPRQRTLDDVKTLRSRVLQEMRDEQAAQGRGPNRRKIAVLNDIQKGLLEDLTATGVQGVDEARAFSAQLNSRYRSGRIGRLMGFDATGAERVASEDFLQDIIYGPHNATNAKLLGEMASEAPDLSLDFIRRKYMDSVVDPSGSINQRAHNSFVKNAKDKGLFEIFPELEGELTNVSAKSLEAMRLQVPDRKRGSMALSPEQSRAALMLQALPGDEMAFVLRAKNPQGAIRDIMKTRAPDGNLLRTDLQAVRGMQDAFVEELFNQATKEVNGEMVVQGHNLKALMNEHAPVMRELNMGEQQVRRLNGISEEIRLSQLSAPKEVDIGGTIMNTQLSKPIEVLARLMGARSGAHMAGNGGGQLVMASHMSKEAQQRLLSLTKSKAERMVVEAVFNGDLYRSLLLGPRSSMAAQQRAAAILEREILRLESVGTATLAVGASQDQPQDEQ